MKLDKLIGLLLLLVLTGCQERIPQNSETMDSAGKSASTSIATVVKPTERPQDLAWGKEDAYGLQMGCWFDSGQRIIWCIIRNKGDRSIRYSDYLLGYWESVTLKARSKKTGKWPTVDRKKSFPKYYKSAGAFSSNIHIIHPRKEMPPPYNGNGTLIPVAIEPEYTFCVSLDNFEWPEDLKNDIHVVVSQSLGDDGSEDTWKGTLQSGKLLLKTKPEK